MSTAVAERSWSVVVPHHARGARLARHRLAAELGEVVDASLLADTIAVLAELVGNAIRHADPLPGGVVKVSWRLHATGRQAEAAGPEAQAAGPDVPAAGPEAQAAEPDARAAGTAPQGHGQGKSVTVCVTDGGTPHRSPTLRTAGAEAVDGRGLRIVVALAQRWGIERDGLGQNVWAQMLLG